MVGQVHARRTRIFPQVGNPSREAHERRPQLMRRFPRHGHPQPITRRGHLRAVSPACQQRQTEEHRPFERGDAREPPRGGARAIVNRPDSGLHQRRVLDVQLGDPRAQARRVGAHGRRRVVERRDLARGIGHDDGDAEGADLAGEVQEGVGGRVGAGIVQTRKYAPQQHAGLARIVAQMTGDHPGVSDGDAAEQQRQADHGGRTGAAQRRVTHHAERAA